MNKILLLAALISPSIFAVAPYYSARSQSVNAARELVGAGWNTNINICGTDGWNGVFAIAPEYTKSFRPYYISQCLFGRQYCFPPCPECTNACNPCNNDDLTGIKITGSQVISRGPGDWLADYFGLPTDYIGCISFEPRIENFLVDFNFYLGLDAWCNGLYFRIHAPVVHTRWDLDCCECITQSIEGCGRFDIKGSNAHWPGYFSETVITNTIGIVRTDLVNSFESFMNECNVINDSTIVFNPLCYARICCQRLEKTSLSDIQMALGWNFLCNEDYHLGLNIRTATPTGNRPEGEFLFEPIIGNGKHWELGGGLSSHWTFWKNHNDEESATLYLDANITHLFKTKQCRTFDLCCKPLSRYMLASKFGTPVNDLKAGESPNNAEAPAKQFLGIYSPVANLTTFAVDVSIGIQADIALMVQYTNDNCSCDFGYNLWTRSCEKIERNCSCYPFEQDTWGLKGDAFMYGFKTLDGSLTATAVPLSATQSYATIYNGTNNWPTGINGIIWPQNPEIDNKQLAWDDDDSPLVIYDATHSTTAQVYTSKEPVFINLCDIDLNGARTKGLSHKIFAHFNYTWHNDEDWVPYIGIGGEIEFGRHCNNDCCSQCCDPYALCQSYLPCNPCQSSCNQYCDSYYNPYCQSCYSPCDNSCCCSCAVSQWGIWLKGGVAFQ